MPAALHSQLLAMRTVDLLVSLPEHCGIMVEQSSFRSRFPEERQQWTMFRAIRTALVVAATLVAMFVPGFGNFISLIGARMLTFPG